MRHAKRIAGILPAMAALACARGPANSGANPGNLTSLQFPASIDLLKAALAPKGKPLVINHWATWCVPCVAELPYLAKVARRFEGKVDFIFIAWDNVSGDLPHDTIREAVDRVRERCGITFPTLVSPPGISEVAKQLSLLSESVPQTFVISKTGARAWSILGEIQEDSDQADFEQAIENALKE